MLKNSQKKGMVTKMKKIMAMLMTIMLTVGSFGVAVMAENPDSVKVYVTIADKNGRLPVVLEEITVTDVDNDGALTINDALYIAHESKFEGGAAAGYSTETGTYGLSINKLWGTDTISVGYYVNNMAAWSLADPVADGDVVNAFVYQDAGFTDKYSYFDNKTVSANEGEEITLLLTKIEFDAAWNPVPTKAANATITVDGIATSHKTDAEGKVTLTLEKGTHIISAVSGSDSEIIVPPVCKANVSAKDVTSANTGDNKTLCLILIVAAVSGLALVFMGNRRVYEK